MGLVEFLYHASRLVLFSLKKLQPNELPSLLVSCTCLHACLLPLESVSAGSYHSYFMFSFATCLAAQPMDLLLFHGLVEDTFHAMPLISSPPLYLLLLVLYHSEYSHYASVLKWVGGFSQCPWLPAHLQFHGTEVV